MNAKTAYLHIEAPPPKNLRVALIFDDTVRPDTTGIYCRRALQSLADTVHLRPEELARTDAHRFDMAIYIDDGLAYPFRNDLAAVTALWAIDTHLNPQRLIRRAPAVDLVFAAQRNAVQPLREAGLQVAGWLPLAADPDLHAPVEVQRAYDVCFIAHFNTPERLRLAQALRQISRPSFVGQCFFDDMARTYSQSRLAINLSVRDDINMRVFESLACGAPLLTNGLSGNGLNELFTPGVHLATYVNPAAVTEQIEELLADQAKLLTMAAAGRAAVLERHTYRHRMQTLLAMAAAKLLPPIVPQPMTSIVIVTHNGVALTQACIDSIARHTPEPHEVIVIDNASTDSTAEFLAGRPEIRSVTNAENMGFPSAANQGIRLATGQNILLLNNDTVVTQGWLAGLLSAFQSQNELGLVGPVSNCVSGSQQVSASYADPSTDGGAGLNATALARTLMDVSVRPTDRLVGFCLLIRREVFQRIGLLDERFGIGNFEDDDLCRRALRAGYRCGIAEGVFIHHVGSATFKSGGIDFAALMRRNQSAFERKWQVAAHLPTRVVVGEDRSTPALSVCMIVRDSARTLGASLESVRPWADELIVVDTGSVDATVDIARSHGAEVSFFPWQDDFSAARNASFERARGRWLFWMDSDDTIDADNGRRLKHLATSPAAPGLLGYIIQVHCPPASGDGATYDTPTAVDHVKLVRNRPDIRFSGRIHEQLLPAIRRAGGDVAWTDLFVVHSGSDCSPAGRARKHERDLRLLRMEVADRPDCPFTHFNLGMTLLDARRPGEALDSLCRSLQLADDGESHVRKVHALIVECYSEVGRIETALRACRKGLDHFPDDVELLFRYGVLQQRVGRLAQAAACFDAIVTRPRKRVLSSVDRGLAGPKAWHNLAIVREQLGDAAGAAAAWQNVLRAVPTHPVALAGLSSALRTMACSEGVTATAP